MIAAAALHIGQHVRHRDYKGQRVTGTVRAIGIEDNAVMVTVGLDAPIVIPPCGGDDREIRIHVQLVPAHELAPFDERDEVMAELQAALHALLLHHDELGAKPADQALLDRGYAALAKSRGVTA